MWPFGVWHRRENAGGGEKERCVSRVLAGVAGFHRGVALGAGLVMAGGLALFATGAGAAPQPSVSQVQGKINQLTSQFDKVSQQLDQAGQQLSAAQSRLSQGRLRLNHP